MFVMRSGYILSLVPLWGVLGCKGILCTSSQNLHMLLRHPHYAEGHQHALQNHLSYPTPFPSRKAFDARTSYVPPHYSSSPTSTRVAEEGSAPWNRVGPITKDYYKMSHVKSPSASMRAIVEPPMPQELVEVREANEHFVRMRSGARCQLPRAEVVCVRDVYPDKEFLPRCTLLHRCSETAGCCENDTLQCGPKAMQEVVLHFYVLGDHKSSNVEKLLFVNHTECECQPKHAEETPSSIATTTASSFISTTSSSSTTTTESVYENDVDHFPQRDQKSPKCRPCPSPFCVRELELGRCSCDCFDKHKPCIRVKRGREVLGDSERRCVQSGQCNIPDCDYGGFDPEKGRCPRRPDHDTFKGGRPHPNHRNPNHRWTYFERD